MSAPTRTATNGTAIDACAKAARFEIIADFETSNRFAPDVLIQGTGYRMEKGIEIIAAHSPGAFVDDTPTTTFVSAGPRRRSAARQGDYDRQAARRARSQASADRLVRGRRATA